jgi:hypothetical protein
MPKALCVLGMVVAVLLAILFAMDLAIGAPFRGASRIADIGFIVCAVILAYTSFTTWREQI